MLINPAHANVNERKQMNKLHSQLHRSCYPIVNIYDSTFRISGINFYTRESEKINIYTQIFGFQFSRYSKRGLS